MRIQQILDGHREVHTCDADRPLTHAVSIMAENSIRALVALGTNRAAVGVLSVKDVMGAIHRDGPEALEKAVREYMSKGVITVRPSDELADVEKLIAEQAIHHLPVVEAGEVVGLVTTADVLSQHLREQDGVNHDLVSYISGYPS